MVTNYTLNKSFFRMAAGTWKSHSSCKGISVEKGSISKNCIQAWSPTWEDINWTYFLPGYYFQFVLYSSFSIKTPLLFLEEWYKWETTVMTILVKFSFWLHINPHKTSHSACIPVTKGLLFAWVTYNCPLHRGSVLQWCWKASKAATGN